MGRPVELAPAEFVDLPSPANCEIVVEGLLHPGATEVDEPIFLSPDAYNAVYHLSATMNELLDQEAWPRG